MQILHVNHFWFRRSYSAQLLAFRLLMWPASIVGYWLSFEFDSLVLSLIRISNGLMLSLWLLLDVKLCKKGFRIGDVGKMLQMWNFDLIWNKWDRRRVFHSNNGIHIIFDSLLSSSPSDNSYQTLAFLGAYLRDICVIEVLGIPLRPLALAETCERSKTISNNPMTKSPRVNKAIIHIATAAPVVIWKIVRRSLR